MRRVAMKLHTKDQSPKEGEREAPKPQTWSPTREGYLRFLTESKVVYDVVEKICKEGAQPEYTKFASTGEQLMFNVPAP